MSEICPYCGTRSPGKLSCRDCGGILDELSEKATQIAMGPWYFRVSGKPWAPGCSLDVLQRMMKAGKIKPGSQVRGPATGQLWHRAENIPGLAHHTGRCHECYADVDPGTKSCFGCGTQFPTLSDEINSLGIADGSTEAVAKAVQQQRKVDPHTCPRCASHMEAAACCDHCDAIFDPPAEATPMTLGPWFYRSNATAYYPGISFERMLELISVGSITSQTIMRGPTTEQFWTLAKSVEGIAHRLGFCHACDAEVDPHDKSCRACGTTFSDPPSNDQLGLRYTTQADRDAAQKQLDEKLKEIAASQPATQWVAPAVQSTTSRSAQSEYELFDEDDEQHAEDDSHTDHYDDAEHVGEYDSDHHHDEHHDDHHEHESYTHDSEDDVFDDIANARQRRPRKSDHLAGHLESVASQMHGEHDHDQHHVAHDVDHDSGHHADHDFHSEPAVAPEELAAATGASSALTPESIIPTGATAADAKVRRQKSQLDQNKTKLATAALISVLMLVGVVVLIVVNSGTPSSNGTETKDEAANSSKDTSTTKFASQTMIDMRRSVEDRWKTYSTVQTSQAFSALLTEARDKMVAARELYGKQAYDDSQQAYKAASKAMDGIEALLDQQQAAQYAARRSIAAQNTAQEFDVEKLAAEQWATAGEILKQAEEAMRNEQFAKAAESYDKAIATYGKATLFVQHMREAGDARASIAADIKKRYDENALESFGGEPWQRISNNLKTGDDFAEQKKFGLAMESYSKVRPIFTQLDIVMRRGQGRRFYAYRTGRVTAELITLKWKGTAISEDQFAALKQLYADLQLPPTFTSKLPTAADVTPSDFAKTLQSTTMEQLNASFTGDDGNAVKTSYRIGVNFSIVEQLIDTELGALNLRTKNEIRTTLKQLRLLLTEAGWDRQVTGMLDGFEATLIEEKDSSDRTRAAWRDIAGRMDQYDSGNPLTRSDS